MARVDNRQLTDEEIEEVKRLNPVEDVIPEYGIQLRAEGPRFKGLCPFHPDANHPNLTVFPDKRRWRCFACQEWGDVIGFVQRKENITFLDAYQRLRARRPGTVSTTIGARSTTYPDTSKPAVSPPAPKAERPRKPWDRLNLQEQMVMNSAGLVYQDALWHNPQALAYVRERGLPDWTIRQCALGYADGHSLELFLRRHAGLRIAEQLGLLRAATSERGCRELLGGRITVPELRGGQCIWFIGRSLQEHGDGPKYVALPGERPVLGLERAAGRREAFVCEGVFDYLTAVVWGLAVCSFCGTYLPDDRLGFLASAKAIYGLFDPDAAGQAAADRAHEQLGQRFQSIGLPAGCDLSDLGCRPEGRTTFFQLLAAARAVRRDQPTGEAAESNTHIERREVTYAPSD